MEHPNLTYINQLSAGDQVFKERLIQIVKKELPEEIQWYRKTLESENLANIASCVHKLKHKISILGMRENYKLAEMYEENLKKGIRRGQQKFESILLLMTEFVIEL